MSITSDCCCLCLYLNDIESCYATCDDMYISHQICFKLRDIHPMKEDNDEGETNEGNMEG